MFSSRTFDKLVVAIFTAVALRHIYSSFRLVRRDWDTNGSTYALSGGGDRKVGTLQRLPFSGNIISFHISFQYERAKEFHGRERCTS